jgi:hypothetical protein
MIQTIVANELPHPRKVTRYCAKPFPNPPRTASGVRYQDASVATNLTSHHFTHACSNCNQEARAQCEVVRGDEDSIVQKVQRTTKMLPTFELDNCLWITDDHSRERWRCATCGVVRMG